MSAETTGAGPNDTHCEFYPSFFFLPLTLQTFCSVVIKTGSLQH